MKIKLVIMDGDINYLNRITSILGSRFSDRLAVYAFTGPEAALAALEKEKIDVFIADDSFADMDLSAIPSQCGFAYFVDAPDIAMMNGHSAICKFQKADLIYKQILAVYSETLSNASVRNVYSDHTKILLFSSPCGGAGTSTAAAACAVRFAVNGRRCIYLNLEKLGGSTPYFSGEGTFDMSDVIYAIKSGKGGLSLKLESCARQDSHGVYFFDATKIALDMLEFTAGEQANLISVLAGSGLYDYVIVDADFGLDANTLSVFHQAHVLIWVSNVKPSSVFKLKRAYTALSMKETEDRLVDRLCLLYNNIPQPYELPDVGVSCAGILPEISAQANGPVVDRLAESGAFDALIAK